MGKRLIKDIDAFLLYVSFVGIGGGSVGRFWCW